MVSITTIEMATFHIFDMRLVLMFFLFVMFVSCLYLDSIRDLCGLESTLEGKELYDAKSVVSIKVRLTPLTLLGRIKKRTRKSHSHAHEVDEVVITFEESKVIDCKCTCMEFEHDGNLSDTDSNDSRSSPTCAYFSPCAHVSAVLFVLQKKQQEHGSAHVDMFIYEPIRTLDQKCQETEILSRIETFNTKQLNELLKLNEQRSTGTKVQLMARIADAAVGGTLPKCTKCGIGHLSYKVSKSEHFIVSLFCCLNG
jgi:hypothetical protein